MCVKFVRKITQHKQYKQRLSGILRDKTIDDKLMYTPNLNNSPSVEIKFIGIKV